MQPHSLVPFNQSADSVFMGVGVRLILFSLLFVFSTSIFATDYSWRFSTAAGSSGMVGTVHSSPLEGCLAADGKRTHSTYTPMIFRFLTLEKQSDTSFRCKGQQIDTGNNNNVWADNYYFGTLTREGDSCPDGKIYNNETGSCDQDCSSTLDDYLLLRGPDSSVFNSNGVNYISSTADSVSGSCSQGCGYEPTSSFGASCYLVSGSTTSGYCNYIARGTGEACSAQNITPGDMSGDPLNGPSDPGPDPDPDPDPQPDPCHGVPGFTWTGSTCIPTPPGDGPGDGDGGGDNGGGDNGGGGNNGGGDSGGGDSGGGDSGGGTPGTGDGSGGTGDGDCTGDDCGDDDESSASGTDCNQALQCSGDAIQCAILQQQKQQRCYAEEMGDFESQRSAIESMFSGEEYTMDEEEIEVPSFIRQGTRFLPASCPPPVAIALSGRTYQLSLEPWCFFADALGYLIVAFAALAGALYVGRAFGGG